MDRGAFDPGLICECKWQIKRPCKRSCCRKYYEMRDSGWIDDIFFWECADSKNWVEKRDLTVGYVYTYGLSEQDKYNSFKLTCACARPSAVRDGQQVLNKKQCR